jgi:hypothetical protein
MWTLELNGRKIGDYEMDRGSEFEDGGIVRAWWEDTNEELSIDEMIKLNEDYDHDLYDMAVDYYY